MGCRRPSNSVRSRPGLPSGVATRCNACATNPICKATLLVTVAERIQLVISARKSDVLLCTDLRQVGSASRVSRCLLILCTSDLLMGIRTGLSPKTLVSCDWPAYPSGSLETRSQHVLELCVCPNGVALGARCESLAGGQVIRLTSSPAQVHTIASESVMRRRRYWGNSQWSSSTSTRCIRILR